MPIHTPPAPPSSVLHSSSLKEEGASNHFSFPVSASVSPHAHKRTLPLTLGNSWPLLEGHAPPEWVGGWVLLLRVPGCFIVAAPWHHNAGGNANFPLGGVARRREVMNDDDFSKRWSGGRCDSSGEAINGNSWWFFVCFQCTVHGLLQRVRRFSFVRGPKSDVSVLFCPLCTL